MRLAVVALGAALLAAGCGASRGVTNEAPQPAPGTLGAILGMPAFIHGKDVPFALGHFTTPRQLVVSLILTWLIE